jgi:Zn-dependent peptidase ImmA (M78 family)
VSYVYKQRSADEIRGIANQVLQRFPHRRRGKAVDIEGIIEDLGIAIIPRPFGSFSSTGAYLPKNPRLIVVNEGIFFSVPRARFTLSHEVCHRILEYELWQSGVLPEGADSHELSTEQYDLIESDARALAAEILQPEQLYRERFNSHYQLLEKASVPRALAVSTAVESVAEDFEVERTSAYRRAREVGLISEEEFKALFLDKLAF